MIKMYVMLKHVTIVKLNITINFLIGMIICSDTVDAKLGQIRKSSEGKQQCVIHLLCFMPNNMDSTS